MHGHFYLLGLMPVFARSDLTWFCTCKLLTDAVRRTPDQAGDDLSFGAAVASLFENQLSRLIGASLSEKPEE